MTLSYVAPPRRSLDDEAPAAEEVTAEQAAIAARLVSGGVPASPEPGAVAGPTFSLPGMAPAAVRRRGVSPVVRRRRVTGMLVAVTVAAAVGAGASGAMAAWAVTAVLGVLAVGYGLVALSFNRRAARRELASAFGASGEPAIDWSAFDHRLRLADNGGVSAEGLPAELSVGTAARFIAAYFAALALTPFVVAIRLLGGDLSDLEGHRILRRLIGFQVYWRSQSLKVLTASVATASVAVVGGGATTAAFAAPASYTVQAGDTLTSIAAANGTSVAALEAANELANPNLLMQGQVLNLSGGSSASTGTGVSAESTSGGSTYTVQPGDTLSAIAAANGTTVAALAAANGLSNPNFLMPGQVLTLNGADPVTTAATPTSGSASSDASATTSTDPATTESASSGGSGTYTVQPGDTLGSIAATEGTTVAALAAANDLTNPNLIFVGEVLSLSGSASSSAVTTTPAASTDTTTTPAATPTTAEASLSTSTSGTPATDVSATTPEGTNDTGSDGAALPSTGSLAPAPAAATTTSDTSTSDAAPAASSAAAAAVQTALAQVGVPYVYGGASPAGFDCSGLVMYSWAAAGVSIPRTSEEQYSFATAISESQLEPGDLVFYNGVPPGHVAMYIGNGEVVAANTTGTFVQTQSISYDGTPVGFGRV